MKLKKQDKSTLIMLKKAAILTLLKTNNLYEGRTISGSKSGYREKYPDNLVVFNANLITPNFGKIYWGDLDLTKSGAILKDIAQKVGEDLYVLRESDCRFGNENDPIKDLIKKAVWSSKE